MYHAFLHGLHRCAGAAVAAALPDGAEAQLLISLDGEPWQTLAFVPQTARLAFPLLPPGPHEALLTLQVPRLATHADSGARTIDEAAFLFFSSDFRPQLEWVFPPEGYIFKRGSQRFLRFSVYDAGDQASPPPPCPSLPPPSLPLLSLPGSVCSPHASRTHPPAARLPPPVHAAPRGANSSNGSTRCAPDGALPAPPPVLIGHASSRPPY